MHPREMQPFNAVVKNGRLTLDEPSTLPEGEVVVLLPLNDLLAAADSFGDSGDGGGTVGLSFEIAPSSPPRRWRKGNTVDATALIEELRSI